MRLTAEQLSRWLSRPAIRKSNCWSFRHVDRFNGRVKKLQKFINFCLKVGHRANLKHSKSTWRQLIVLWKLQNHNIKSSGHNAHSALLYRGDVWECSHFHARRLILSWLIITNSVSTPEWHICISQCPRQLVPYVTFKNDTLLKGKLITQNGPCTSVFFWSLHIGIDRR